MNYPKPNTLNSISVRNTPTYISVPGYKFNLVLSGEFNAINNISDPYQILYSDIRVGSDYDRRLAFFDKHQWAQPILEPAIIRKAPPDLSDFEFDTDTKPPSVMRKTFSRIIGVAFFIIMLPVLVRLIKRL